MFQTKAYTLNIYLFYRSHNQSDVMRNSFANLRSKIINSWIFAHCYVDLGYKSSQVDFADVIHALSSARSCLRLTRANSYYFDTTMSPATTVRFAIACVLIGCLLATAESKLQICGPDLTEFMHLLCPGPNQGKRSGNGEYSQ